MPAPAPTYQRDGITLYLGDCREILPHLGKVDACVTDPPYGVGLTAKRAKQRKGGVTSRAGSYSHDDTPQYVKSVCATVIGACLTLAEATAVRPGTRNSHLYPTPDDIGCFYSAAGTGMGKWGFTCMQPIYFYGPDPYLRNRLGARPNSCGQVYPNDANEQKHPCAKPIAMMLWLVVRASLTGHTVLDPFMGSGTTGIACIRTGRRFIGIEIDPTYFEIARKRIDRELDQPFLMPPQEQAQPQEQELPI